jgi:sulfite oxidase
MLQAEQAKDERFVVHQETPLNGGSPVDLLCDSEITPLNRFYVRAHAPVPQIDLSEYRLVVQGLVDTPLTLSLDDIRQNYPKRTLSATLQCAGNRRSEFADVKPLPGESVMWNEEAISTGLWGGASLAEVLAQAGIQPEAVHVEFVSLDCVEHDGEKFGFGGSIPLEKAMAGEVLLAYEMNGEPLPAIHGGPLRMVVPGYIAARSVKWVGQINLRTEPSDNHFQQRDYKLFPPTEDGVDVDWSQGVMLSQLATDAVICAPRDSDTFKAGPVTVRGYAVPGADAQITSVEVSTDDGATWQMAQITTPQRAWTWCIWQIRLELQAGEASLRVRAHDTHNTQQPDDVADIWNYRGYMNNSQYRIQVSVV